MWAPFHGLYSHLDVFWGEISILIFALHHYFNWTAWVVCIFGGWIPYFHLGCHIFLSCGLFCFSFRVPLLLISGSSSSKSTLNIWKFSIHILVKPCLENFEHYFTGVWDECSCAVVWTSFGIPFLSDWNENWPFPVLWPLLSFPNFPAYRVQDFNSIIF